MIEALIGFAAIFILALMRVPLAFAMFALIVVSVFFAWQSRATLNARPVEVPAAVVTRTVEVPVIQQRQVTRVVYRNRPGLAPQIGQKTRSPQPQRVPQFAVGLAGFTPVGEANLTIIKASYHDEK